ncbi:hypothetical protein L7F22_023468 [Adiantum nelumboides]|nr:hypothetical protein [Adiantum nelumboides]
MVSTQKCRWRWRWRPLGALALGQLLSLLITTSGVTSSRLAFLGIHAPTTQSLCNYVLLATIYGSIFLYQKRKLQVRWYYYALLAIVDVEANYLAVKAYQYTTITSILLLDRASLLFVLALTWIVLKKRHTLGEFGGVVVCMAGVVVLFFSDVQPSSKKGAKELIKGDVMVLVASFLYAISNVLEEVILREDGFVELTACLGLFGSIVSSCQVCVLEINEIKAIKWSVLEVLPFFGYAISLFSFYTLVPVFLKKSLKLLTIPVFLFFLKIPENQINGSTSLNLALISSDIWATLVKKFIYRQNVGPLYYLALSIVGLGLIIHSSFNRPQGVPLSKDCLQTRAEGSCMSRQPTECIQLNK